MTSFKCKCIDFKNLLKSASCSGTIEYKKSKTGGKTSVKKDLFSTFYLDVNKEEGALEVVAMDTWYKNIAIDIILKNIDVIEEGVLRITDPSAILGCLDNINDKSMIYIDGENLNMKIVTGDGMHEYTIRQMSSEDLESMDMDYIYGWKESVKGKDDDGFLKLIIEDDFRIYPMKVKVDKSDFTEMIKDKNVTKDEETTIISANGTIFVESGKPNANIQGKHAIVIKEKHGEMLEFRKVFYALHVIIPNLFKEIVMNFRQMDDGRVGLNIESEEKDLRIVVETSSQTEGV